MVVVEQGAVDLVGGVGVRVAAKVLGDVHH